MVSLKIRLQIPGHPINIGGLSVKGVRELRIKKLRKGYAMIANAIVL